MRFLVFALGTAAANDCSGADAMALSNIQEADMTTCMGSSTSASTLQSCLSQSGVSVSSACVNCLSAVATSAQTCGGTCAADPSSQACSSCIEAISQSALDCFGTGNLPDLPTGSGLSEVTTTIDPSVVTTTTKSAATLPIAVVPMALLFAAVLL